MATDTCLDCGGRLEKILEDVVDTRFGISDAYTICRCELCGLEQTTPLPSPEELTDLYAAHYNFGGGRGGLYGWLREWFLSSVFYRLWIVIDGDISFHGIKGTGRLVDIGCNEGRGLCLYRVNGFDAEGLEINPVAAAVARQKGFVVHEGDIAGFSPDDLFDVAVLSNVLEHALDPKSLLARLHNILKPGGEVWITCPNSDSLLRRIFGRFWINWHVPFHIVHFSPATLARILEENGFRLHEAGQATPSLWVTHSLIASIFSRPGKVTRTLRNPVIVMAGMLFFRLLLFPVLWLLNQMRRGECLIVRAVRKPS